VYNKRGCEDMLGLFNFCIGVIIIIFGGIMFKIAQKNFQEGDREGGWSGILAAGTCFAMGGYEVGWGIYGLLNQGNLAIVAPMLPIPYPLGFYTLCFLPVIIGFIVLYVIKEKRDQKSIPSKEGVEDIQKIHPLDLEVSRKAFHITIIGILTCYLFVGELASNTLFGYLSTNWDIWHISINLAPPPELAGKAFSLFMIVAIFMLLILTDFVRIYAPRYYPVKTISKVYREKEKNTLGPHVLIAVGITFAVLFFSPPIAMAVIAMAALGDAAATIVGVTVGKHKIHPQSKKTWEGCVAGVVVSFSTGFLCMIVLIGTFNFSAISAALILNGVGALIFFVIDYYTPRVPLTDNILNPICIGGAMTALAYLLFPIVL
jgi:dolichol kinase